PRPGMDEETAAQVRLCLDSLGERDRTLLERHFIDGQSYDEMANDHAILPQDERTASARAQVIRGQTLAARARLRQCLLVQGVDPQQWGCLGWPGGLRVLPFEGNTMNAVLDATFLSLLGSLCDLDVTNGHPQLVAADRPRALAGLERILVDRLALEEH